MVKVACDLKSGTRNILYSQANIIIICGTKEHLKTKIIHKAAQKHTVHSDHFFTPLDGFDPIIALFTKNSNLFLKKSKFFIKSTCFFRKSLVSYWGD